jgi:hypothetical protein
VPSLSCRYFYHGGAWVAQWLGHCAKSRKVPGSIPGATGVLSAAYEISMCPGVDSASKNEYQANPGGKGGRGVRLTTYHIHVSMSRNKGALTSWNRVGLFTAVLGQLYLFYHYFKCTPCTAPTLPRQMATAATKTFHVFPQCPSHTVCPAIHDFPYWPSFTVFPATHALPNCPSFTVVHAIHALPNCPSFTVCPAIHALHNCLHLESLAISTPFLTALHLQSARYPLFS